MPEEVTPLKVDSEAEAVSAETVAPQVEPVEPEEDLGLTVEDVLGTAPALATAATTATEQQALEPVEPEDVTPIKVSSETEVVSAEIDAPKDEPVKPEEDLGLTVEDVLGTAPAPEAVAAATITTEQQALEPVEPEEVTPLTVSSEAESVSAETVEPQDAPVEPEEDLGLTVEDVLGTAPAPEAVVATTTTTTTTTERQALEPVEPEEVTSLKVSSDAVEVSAETATPQDEPVEPEEDLGLTVEDVLGAEAAPKVDATVATAVTTEQQASEPNTAKGRL